MQILQPTSWKEFGRMYKQYDAQSNAGHKINIKRNRNKRSPSLPSLLDVVYIDNEQRRNLTWITSSNNILNENMYEPVNTADIIQIECNNFQLCLIDNKVIFVEINNNKNTNHYMIWPLNVSKRDNNGNNDVLFGVAVPHGEREHGSRDRDGQKKLQSRRTSGSSPKSNNNNKCHSSYWKLVNLMNKNDIISYFGLKLNEFCINTINGMRIYNFHEQFNYYLPKRFEIEPLPFDEKKEISMNSGKLLKHLRKVYQHSQEQINGINGGNNNGNNGNTRSKHGSFLNDIKELGLNNMDELFGLMLDNIYDTMFYSKLNSNIVKTQVYIDKFNGIYHREHILLLEILNKKLGKVHKYGLTLIENKKNKSFKNRNYRGHGYGNYRNNNRNNRNGRNNNKNSNNYSISCVHPGHLILANTKLVYNSNNDCKELYSMFGNSKQSFYNLLKHNKGNNLNTNNNNLSAALTNNSINYYQRCKQGCNQGYTSTKVISVDSNNLISNTLGRSRSSSISSVSSTSSMSSVGSIMSSMSSLSTTNSLVSTSSINSMTSMNSINSMMSLTSINSTTSDNGGIDLYRYSSQISPLIGGTTISEIKLLSNMLNQPRTNINYNNNKHVSNNWQ